MHIETANAESLLVNPAGAHPWSRREEVKKSPAASLQCTENRKVPSAPEMKALMQEASSFHS